MNLSLLQAAADEPDGTALVDAGAVVSFAELAAEVRGAVARLGELGVRRGEPVGILGESSRRALVWLYALFEVGAPAVMVHPRATAAERRRFLADCGAARWLEPGDGWVGTAPPVDSAELAAPEPGSTLAIVQTSGSSGRPKGVVLSRRAFSAAAAASAENLGWRDDDRWLLSLPIAHVGGLSVVTRCLLARRAVVVEPSPRFDADRLAPLLESRRVTLFSVVPTMLRRLLDLDRWHPPARLRAILVGGAATPPALLARAADRGWPVLTTYGLTEACSQVATQRYGTVQRGELGSGPPVAGMEVRTRNGAIEIRGASLFDGYLPAGSSPFTADGWFATGDLGHLDDAGNLQVLGRRDEVISTGGELVHPGEVEAALEADPAVAAACVFGVADEEWGEVVVAVVEIAPGADAPASDAGLTKWLAPRLAELAKYKRPRRIVRLGRLPRTPSGKVDRRRCLREFGAGGQMSNSTP